MKNYLMVGDVKIPLSDISESQFRAIVATLEREQKEKVATVNTSFTRAFPNSHYYSINFNGKICENIDRGDDLDNALYEVGNYCTNKKLMEQRALHEILNRLLWRFSEENGGEGKKTHWYIWLDSKFHVDWTCSKKYQGIIYFSSGEIAKRALDEIVIPFMREHPEFVW